METMRLGIIGTGRIAGRAAAEIRYVPEIEITAVINPNIAHAVQFAKSLPCAYAKASVEEAAEWIDAVYIASPHGTHYGYARELLQKGKHVLCEKPMTFHPTQAEELYAVAEETRTVLMEAIKTAYCPGFRKLEELAGGGRIGDIVDVDAVFSRLTARGQREWRDTAYGGAFTEFGSYGLLPVLRFLGEDWRELKFLSQTEGGVDGYTRAVMDYGDRFAAIRTGMSAKTEGQLVISGTKGYLLVPSPWWLTRQVEVHYEDPQATEHYDCEYAGDGLRYEFAEFVRRVAAARRGERMAAVLPAERREAIARARIFEAFLENRRG